MKEEKESVRLSMGEERIGGAQTLRNESDELLFTRDIDSNTIRVEV